MEISRNVSVNGKLLFLFYRIIINEKKIDKSNGLNPQRGSNIITIFTL